MTRTYSSSKLKKNEDKCGRCRRSQREYELDSDCGAMTYEFPVLWSGSLSRLNREGDGDGVHQVCDHGRPSVPNRYTEVVR